MVRWSALVGRYLHKIQRCTWYLILAVVWAAAPAAHAVTANEGKLRAAVIVGIMRFTSWPNQPQINDAESLDLCLIGRPTSQEFLLPISGERKVAGKALSVREVPQAKIHQCRVLVIGSGVSRGDTEQLLRLADGLSMLTVCDGCRNDFADGPIIYLTLRKQKVNFAVNLVRAKQTGVLLDAQLLELASEVRK